jgi:HAE1 family hydrophobic/amphiphilic exporter-1
LIIAHSIPISIISTFVLLYFGKFTLNIMTLGGLIIAIGKLVDDSVVVIDNIERHRGLGSTAGTAAIDGTREVITAVGGQPLPR